MRNMALRSGILMKQLVTPPLPGGRIRVRATSIAVLLISLFLVDGRATAQSDGANAPGNSLSSVTSESFGKTFFYSRVTHANGESSVDLIGSMLLWTLMTLSALNIGLIGYLSFANQRKTIYPEGVAKEMRRLLSN